MALSALTEVSATAATTTADVRMLYLTHGPALRQALHRLSGGSLDAEDLLQDVFVIALRRADALAAADSKAAWLYGVAIKVFHGRRRTARWKRWLGLEALEDVPSPDSPHLSLEQQQARFAVERGLAKLSAIRREVLVLFELQGLSGAEVAAALEIPVKTVWTRLFHARKDFAAAIQEANRHG